MPIRDTGHQLYHLHNGETLVKRHTFSEAVEVFATSPRSANSTTDKYLREVIEVAQWSEQHGCTDTLVYTDNRLADPWLVAQIILRYYTDILCPHDRNPGQHTVYHSHAPREDPCGSLLVTPGSVGNCHGLPGSDAGAHGTIVMVGLVYGL
jgi:hypothetical protein